MLTHSALLAAQAVKLGDAAIWLDYRWAATTSATTDWQHIGLSVPYMIISRAVAASQGNLFRSQPFRNPHFFVSISHESQYWHVLEPPDNQAKNFAEFTFVAFCTREPFLNH